MRYAIATLEEPAARHRPVERGSVRVAGTVVIVGNGMVGHRLCRQLATQGVTQRYRVVVFGEEPEPAYDRVHLTDVLGGRDEADLALSPADWYRHHGIDLHLGDPIVAIDRESRMVTASSGTAIAYTHLVLATGSSPYIPPIEGADLPGVFVYRTLGDLRALRTRVQHGCTAAVIGGGLLGLEAARALQGMSMRVTVIEAAAALMPSQLDQRGGEALERQITAFGIAVKTSARTKRIETHGPWRTLHLAGGDTLTVDVVVIAAGIRPRAELARRCGLAQSPDGGIVVDDRLQTSDAHVFAIGECASHRSEVYGLAAPGYAMADVLAANLAGRPALFTGAQSATRLKLLGVDVATAGDPLDGGSAVRARDDASYRLVRVVRGRLTGAMGVGSWQEFGRIQDAIARRARVWPWQLRRFERTGTLWRVRADRPVSEWSRDAVVCHCMNVTCGQLADVCAQEIPTVQALAARTGASTLCGSCRPLLEQFSGVEETAPAPIAGGLLITSAVALTTVIALIVSAPAPFSGSIQDPWRLDVLWRSGGYRQASGFVLLGLALMASLLSARKRWRRASTAGPFTAWRLAHAVIGVLTLVTLAMHTGGRVGDNLNFALMASFGALNVLGALAGGLTAVEHRLRARAGSRGRAALVAAHIIAIWPLPMLVAFHVVSVYYF